MWNNILRSKSIFFSECVGTSPIQVIQQKQNFANLRKPEQKLYLQQVFKVPPNYLYLRKPLLN